MTFLIFEIVVYHPAYYYWYSLALVLVNCMDGKAGDICFKVAAIFCVLLPEWKMKIMAETRFLHEETVI